jgi:hypothetical protein
MTKNEAHCITNNLSSPARNGALLNDDSTRLRSNGNIPSCTLKSHHISSSSSSNTSHLGRRIDTQENNIGLRYALGDIGREEEVLLTSRKFNSGCSIDGNFCGVRAVTGDSYDLVETRLMDRRVLRVPFADSSGVFVYDRDSDIGILECNDSCRWPTW